METEKKKKEKRKKERKLFNKIIFYGGFTKMKNIVKCIAVGLLIGMTTCNNGMNHRSRQTNSTKELRRSFRNFFVKISLRPDNRENEKQESLLHIEVLGKKDYTYDATVAIDAAFKNAVIVANIRGQYLLVRLENTDKSGIVYFIHLQQKKIVRDKYKKFYDFQSNYLFFQLQDGRPVVADCNNESLNIRPKHFKDNWRLAGQYLVFELGEEHLQHSSTIIECYDLTLGKRKRFKFKGEISTLFFDVQKKILEIRLTNGNLTIVDLPSMTIMVQNSLLIAFDRWKIQNDDDTVTLYKIYHYMNLDFVVEKYNKDTREWAFDFCEPNISKFLKAKDCFLLPSCNQSLHIINMKNRKKVSLKGVSSIKNHNEYLFILCNPACKQPDDRESHGVYIYDNWKERLLSKKDLGLEANVQVVSFDRCGEYCALLYRDKNESDSKKMSVKIYNFFKNADLPTCIATKDNVKEIRGSYPFFYIFLHDGNHEVFSPDLIQSVATSTTSMRLSLGCRFFSLFRKDKEKKEVKLGLVSNFVLTGKKRKRDDSESEGAKEDGQRKRKKRKIRL